jgi:hypothetical protein
MDVGGVPSLRNSKDSKLQNAVINKKRGHDFAFGSGDSILKKLKV